MSKNNRLGESMNANWLLVCTLLSQISHFYLTLPQTVFHLENFSLYVYTLICSLKLLILLTALFNACTIYVLSQMC